MKICFLIPDGIGIRNYLYSDVIPELFAAGHEVALWHSLDPELIAKVEDRLGMKFEQHPFTHKADGVRVQLLREAGRFARIKLNAKLKQNPSILTNWSGASSSIKGRILIRAAATMGNLLNNYSAVAKTEALSHRLLQSSSEFSHALKILNQISPDLLFCTHQRVFSVTASIEAAKSMGIPTSTAVFSWDNLPKGRLPFRVDQYFVWSNHMKQELLTYYPEISPSQIQITGTPQFDFYFEKKLILKREEFAQKYGLDLSKKWVCFSGCDTLTSPDDPLYLQDVAQALRENDNSFQLIFRPVPVESSQRFRNVLDQFSEIKVIDPIWVKGNHWGNFFPLMDDIQLLVNLAYHCKVVVNMGSTMALDFSTFGNVGLYLRYDHEGVSATSSVNTIYSFQHFRSIGDWRAVGYIWSPDQILPQINRAWDEPDQVAPDREKWFQKIVEPNQDCSSAKRVASALVSMVLPSNL